MAAMFNRTVRLTDAFLNVHRCLNCRTTLLWGVGFCIECVRAIVIGILVAAAVAYVGF